MRSHIRLGRGGRAPWFQVQQQGAGDVAAVVPFAEEDVPAFRALARGILTSSLDVVLGNGPIESPPMSGQRPSQFARHTWPQAHGVILAAA